MTLPVLSGSQKGGRAASGGKSSPGCWNWDLPLRLREGEGPTMLELLEDESPDCRGMWITERNRNC